PIVGRAVHRAVLAHRGHDHPVYQEEVAEPERREERRRWRADGYGYAALLAGPRGEPAVHVADELGIADLQVVVRDPQAPREQVEGELDRHEIHVALGALEPLETDLRGALQALDHRSPLRLVRRQRGGDV